MVIRADIKPEMLQIIGAWHRFSPTEIFTYTGFDRDLWPLIRPVLTEHPNIKITGRKRGTRYELEEAK